VKWAGPTIASGWFGYVPRGVVPGGSAPSGVILVRFVGIMALGLTMFMILVAQKIEAVWWWSWAFVIANLLVFLVSVLHIAFGLPPRAPSAPWWLTAGISLAFAIALMWGLFKAQQEQPIIEA